MSVRRLASARVGVAAIVLTGVVLSACGGGSGSNAQTKRKEPASTTTTTRKAVPVAPFTGLPDPQGVANGRSSLAVKIENTPEARPQSGLDQADVVYEEVVEGGITRFWAVFNSAAPDVVGPIRSVRVMDPNIVLPFGGVLAFSGGTQDNVNLVRATGLVWVDESNAGGDFFRERSRSAPHNLYGNTAGLWARGGTPVPPTPLFTYREKGQQVTGEPVAAFHVRLASGYDMAYVWNPDKGGWDRFQQGIEPFVAAGVAPVQVAPENVIVQLIPYGGASDGDVMGSGEAWVFTDGQLVRGTWAKAFSPAATQFLDAAGKPIELTPGHTWVELTPIGVAVDVLPGVAPTTSTTSGRTTERTAGR